HHCLVADGSNYFIENVRDTNFGWESRCAVEGRLGSKLRVRHPDIETGLGPRLDPSFVLQPPVRLHYSGDTDALLSFKSANRRDSIANLQGSFPNVTFYLSRYFQIQRNAGIDSFPGIDA